MKALSRFLLLFAPCPAAVCLAEEVREIPLSEVWAYNMPGTKPLADWGHGGRHYDKREDNAIKEFARAIGRPDKSGKQKPGLIATGDHIEALEEAAKVLANVDSGQQVFSANDQVWAVFFTHAAGGSYIHIHRVGVADDIVSIEYKYVHHATMDSTFHFALIPLSDLPPGTYRVSTSYVTSNENEDEFNESLISNPYVSGDCVFSITD